MVDDKSIPYLDDGTGIGYEIKVKGYLNERWADCLGGLNITYDMQGNSFLTGIVRDQAALHGILAQIRDLGLTLIAIAPGNTVSEEKERVTKMLNEVTNNISKKPVIPNG